MEVNTQPSHPPLDIFPLSASCDERVRCSYEVEKTDVIVAFVGFYIHSRGS